MQPVRLVKSLLSLTGIVAMIGISCMMLGGACSRPARISRPPSPYSTKASNNVPIVETSEVPTIEDSSGSIPAPPSSPVSTVDSNSPPIPGNSEVPSQSQGNVYNNMPQSTTKAPIRGITNVGATCYMNSVLQIIAALYEDKAKDSPLKEMIQEINSSGGKAIDTAYVEQFINILPAPTKEMEKYRKQHDASEFMQHLNDNFNFLENYNTSKCTFIKNEHQKIYYKEDQVPQENSIRVPFITGITDLSKMINSEYSGEELQTSEKKMPFKVTITDFSECKADVPPDTNSLSPINIKPNFAEGTVSNKIVKTSLKELPNKLCVALNRFDNNQEKIGTEITGTDAITIKSREQDVNYTLSGFIVHTGKFYGGHYVAYVKKGNTWYKADDKVITLTTNAIKESQKAYLFFYTKE